ncbi:MAG: hypothetical protein KDD02_04785 [Phaeodactylibacter sp.]|nr:hypothetical protein [Phaeodactylibacter sp.]MCB9304155.1 hypothetical protein [Lewinellaceae bacterium]
MIKRSIKVKVLKETPRTITIQLMTLNRKMPVPRQDFEQRVREGEYEVIGGYELEESQS